MTPETRAKISAALRGRVLAPETRAKIGAVQRGRKHTAEHRAKNSAALRARVMSPEHRQRIADGQRGVKRGPLSPETRAKLSTAHLGVKRGPMSDQDRAKLSAAHRGKPLSPDHREAIRAAQEVLSNVHRAPVKGECAYCGGPATGFDHVIPVSRGGTDDPANIVVCCRFCNGSKNDRTPDEWFAGLIATAKPNSITGPVADTP